MRIVYCERCLRFILSRPEANGVKRVDGKPVFLEAKDEEGRKYVLINTADDIYIQFQKAPDSKLYSTIKLGDKALENLVNGGRADVQIGNMEIVGLLEESRN
jgi:hypothetical protein